MEKIYQNINVFSQAYYVNHIKQFENKKNIFLSDWWEAFIYFISFTFYQGRNDSMSQDVKELAKKVLNENIGGSLAILEKSAKMNFVKIREELNKVIGKGLKGKGRDIEMVISILTYIMKLDAKNIVSHSINEIKNNRLSTLFRDLMTITQIGPKIASMYLRDLVTLFSLDVKKEDFYYLQPVDTWVKKFAQKLEIINNNENGEALIRNKIVDECLENQISPIAFNQGAWFLSTNSFDILINILMAEKRH
jgi:hypothetical protein